MLIQRVLAATFSAGLLAAGCGSVDEPTSADLGDEPPATIATTGSEPVSTDAPPNDGVPVDGFRPVASIDEIAGIWVPVEVAGEPVDAAALGAYLRIVANEARVQLDGYDGCNGMGGNPTGVRPAFDDGRFAGMEFGSETGGCDVSIPVSPGREGLLFVSADGDELYVDEIPFTESIRYERVDSIPVDPRQAVWEAENQAEEEARQAEEAAERAALEEAEVTARAEIRTDLPEARTRWAQSAVGTYTLRFEVGALMVDPSFPQRRPVGGVWEIDVIDGIALENEWSDSILGDTVEDWFAYIESQLDSHYLRAEFDATLGAPTLIDSQPLDDMVVEDPNQIAAWLVSAEVVVPA